jgi:hypothetical protein
MDENTLYSMIGRLYTELTNASNIIQNQNNTISQLQYKISELESSLGEQNKPASVRQAQPFEIEDDGNTQPYSPIPAPLNVPESD